MNCVMRAMRYICRKSGKSILLLLIFLVADCTILGALSVLDTSSHINDEIRRQTGAKVTIESMDAEGSLTGKDAEVLLTVENVNGINCVNEAVVYANGFAPVAGSEESEGGQVKLTGFDDMEKDSPFTENACRIVEGRLADGDNEVVINQYLAGYNQIKIGDTVTFAAEDKNYTAVITGLYLTGNERLQTKKVSTINRLENQIYADASFVKKMNEGKYKKIIAYVDKPERISEAADSVRELLGDKVYIRTQDTMYQKMKISMLQVERVTWLIFVFAVMVSIFVVGMLLCMWMRNRKVEFAVFISLGISKAEVFLQMIMEIFFLYTLGSLISAVISGIFMPWLSGRMGRITGFGTGISFSIGNAGKVWFAGTGILIIITLAAMLPCFTKGIKDILSEMEG